MSAGMKCYELYWSPEGKRIAVVTARTMRAAIRKAPKPYRRYLGEIYAVEVTATRASQSELIDDVFRRLA